MGAAIPHLMQLILALPPILPFASDEIHIDVTTGTVDVQDEIIPDDEDEDISYETRAKSTLKVIMKIGDGEFEGDKTGPIKRGGGPSRNAARGRGGAGQKKGQSEPSKGVLLREPEQKDVDMA